jgi:predicted ArsR family transcriptional regulator
VTVRRLTPGDPTDLEILRALTGHGDQPVFADALAPLLGIAPGRVPSRLASLVTLGYVDCLVGEKGRGDGYRLTARGQAELRRRTDTPPAASANGPAAPASR